MEQHRTRPPGARPRRTAPLPEQGSPAEPPVPRTPPRPRGPASPLARALRRTPLYRRVSRMPLYRALRRMPNPRLTGLGSGLFAVAVMFLFACLLRLLFGGSIVAYGVLFLPVSALTALWVRPADLVSAPVSVPIAFAAGVLPISEGTGGFGGQFMGLLTALALHAGWLYGGTLVAGVIVTVRKVRLMARRRQQRQWQQQQRRGQVRPPGHPPQRRVPAS
ncbi:membrane protein [Streptomyces aureoverticillatus]|nr:membrane protein [Streptomyces aureoverticillatus]